MKKFLVLLFTSFLILGACSNKDSSSENSNKSSINKSDKKLHDNKKKKDKSKRKRKNIRKILLVKKIKLAKNKHNYNKISHKCHNKITYNLHLKNKVLKKQQTNANNQQTQQRYDYDHNGVYRTLLNKKHMNSGLRIK